MRWDSPKPKKKIYPKRGEIRIKTKFLFFPLTINEKTRWLEKATYEERYCYRYSTFISDYTAIGGSWDPWLWVN